MQREEELKRFPLIEFPNELSERDLDIAYKKGMLKKKDLIDERYYLGICRNASVAKWMEGENSFIYMRRKFGNVFFEKISHPEDDNGKDLFIPFKEVSPLEPELIQLPQYSNFVLHRKKPA